MHIYALQNKINNKLYFGQTIQDLDKYWETNARNALLGKNYKPALYGAIRKYGKENFALIHIGDATSKEELDNWEKLCILVYGTKNRQFGYNLTDGGDGTIGAERTPEWKANISAGLTGQKFTPERSLAASIQRKGRVLTEAHKANIGAGVKGTKKPPQWIEKLISRNKLRKGEKKPRTAEHQARLGASRKANTLARKLTEETNGFVEK